MTARWFERTVTAAIIANCAVLVAGQVIDGHEDTFESVHNTILAFFALELVVHLRVHGWRFLRRPINAFDALVIVVSALPALRSRRRTSETGQACAAGASRAASLGAAAGAVRASRQGGAGARRGGADGGSRGAGRHRRRRHERDLRRVSHGSEPR